MDGATRAFVEAARRAVLATIDDEGRARLVPICFAIASDERRTADPGAAVLYSPLDEKPKRVDDVRRLARVRDIAARPGVTLLFDRWSEDWSALGWVRIHGVATILEPEGPGTIEHRAAVALLRARYPQYATQGIDRRPLIRVALGATRSWGATGEPPPTG
jgi:PPOX class probable F420-dependent enzyme